MAKTLGGPRLSFYAEKLEGTILRTQYTIEEKVYGKGDKKKVTFTRKQHTVEEPAGYMVYFPMGHAIRMGEDELRARGFDQQPRIINADGLSHATITEQARQLTMETLIRDLKGFVTHKVGSELLTREAA